MRFPDHKFVNSETNKCLTNNIIMFIHQVLIYTQILQVVNVHCFGTKMYIMEIKHTQINDKLHYFNVKLINKRPMGNITHLRKQFKSIHMIIP